MLSVAPGKGSLILVVEWIIESFKYLHFNWRESLLVMIIDFWMPNRSWLNNIMRRWRGDGYAQSCGCLSLMHCVRVTGPTSWWYYLLHPVQLNWRPLRRFLLLCSIFQNWLWGLLQWSGFWRMISDAAFNIDTIVQHAHFRLLFLFPY